MAAIVQKPKSILDRLPVLGDPSAAVIDAVRRLDNSNFADNVVGVKLVQRVPKAGFFDPMSMPNFLFEVEGPGGNRTLQKTVVMDGPATMFDAFGPYVNEKMADGKKAHQTIETGKGKVLRVHAPGSTGEDMALRVSSYLPFDTDIQTESSKIIARCGVRATVPGPANRLEALLWHANEKFASEKPGILYPPTAFKMPPVDALIADAGAKGYMKRPTDDAPFVNRGDSRVANHGNFLVNVPFVTRMIGIKVDTSTESIVSMKKQLREKYMDVVEALFTSMDAMTLSAGGLTSLLASMEGIRELIAVGLDVSRLSELFKSIEEAKAYKFAVPTTIFGPDNAVLTTKDLYELTYKRPKGLTPYIVAEFSYSAYRLSTHDTATVLGTFPRVTIVGLVPAIPIKVMSTADESCISLQVAQSAVEAAFAKRGARYQPALEAPSCKLAIESASATAEAEDDDAAALAAAEAAEASEASASVEADETRKRPAAEDGGRKAKRAKIT